MKKSFKFYILVLIILFQFSCAKEEKITVLKDTDLKTQMIELYNQGYDEFLKGSDMKMVTINQINNYQQLLEGK